MKKTLICILTILCIGVAAYLCLFQYGWGNRIPGFNQYVTNFTSKIETTIESLTQKSEKQDKTETVKEAPVKQEKPETPPKEEGELEPLGDNHDKDAGLIESYRKGLVIHETGYEDKKATNEINKVRKQITDSMQWRALSVYDNGKYSTDINDFNIRKDADVGYLLDYVGNYVVTINLSAEDMKNPKITLLSVNRNVIEEFM